MNDAPLAPRRIVVTFSGLVLGMLPAGVEIARTCQGRREAHQ